jgi:CRISPR/Cas system-associated exonuclease Cas4 (RecB family)
MMNGTAYISKTKFLQGLQCSKLIWSAYNAKRLIPAVDAATQAVFDQGHDVGTFAKRMFPNGIEIDTDPADFEGAIQLTQKHLASRRPIFEATLSAVGGYARVDILNPVGKDEWDVIEVKSTTSLKDVHIPDVAFQAWVFTEADIKIRRCFLCYINNQFVRHGEIDPKEFFTLRDVTAEVSEFSRDLEEQVSQMGNIIRVAKCPDIQIGKQCDTPYSCPLHDHCWSFLPPHNVLDLYDDKKGRGWDLLKNGILKLAEIPADYSLSPKQEIQRETAISGKPHANQIQIQTFLKGLKYPLHFLDFETINTAIPLFDGTRPYEQIPFQFSLHIVRKAGAKPEHHKFLADGRNDPRAEFMRALKSSIEPSGSIVVFNAPFEKSRMKECAEVLPEYASWVTAVNGRIVDLLNPFKAFNYYHPDQCGSSSMKQVLPALTGKDYTSLEIQEGGVASREFLRVTFGDVSESERKRVRLALEKYCGQDTEGMIWILDALGMNSLSFF